MKFTLICQCGYFAHNVDVIQMATVALHHQGALIYPADAYADAANDVLAEAEWCVSQ